MKYKANLSYKLKRVQRHRENKRQNGKYLEADVIKITKARAHKTML